MLPLTQRTDFSAMYTQPLQMRKSSLLCTAYKHQGNVDAMSNMGFDMEDASVSQQVDVMLVLVLSTQERIWVKNGGQESYTVL